MTDLKSVGETHAGSTPAFPIRKEDLYLGPIAKRWFKQRFSKRRRKAWRLECREGFEEYGSVV